MVVWDTLLAVPRAPPHGSVQGTAPMVVSIHRYYGGAQNTPMVFCLVRDPPIHVIRCILSPYLLTLISQVPPLNCALLSLMSHVFKMPPKNPFFIFCLKFPKNATSNVSYFTLVSFNLNLILMLPHITMRLD